MKKQGKVVKTHEVQGQILMKGNKHRVKSMKNGKNEVESLDDYENYDKKQFRTKKKELNAMNKARNKLMRASKKWRKQWKFPKS